MKRHQNNKECNEVTITIVTHEMSNMTVSQTQTNTMSNSKLLKKNNNDVEKFSFITKLMTYTI